MFKLKVCEAKTVFSLDNSRRKDFQTILLFVSSIGAGNIFCLTFLAMLSYGIKMVVLVIEQFMLESLLYGIE